MVKATMQIVRQGKDGRNYLAYKTGDEIDPELAWEYELFNRALIDNYHLVNGKYVLKPGAKPVEKPNKVSEPVVAKATGKKPKK